MNNDARATSLLIEIRDLLAANARPADSMWDVADIAAYTGYSITVTRNKIVKSRGFPRPVILASGGRRWHQAEVRAFFKRANRG